MSYPVGHLAQLSLEHKVFEDKCVNCSPRIDLTNEERVILHALGANAKVPPAVRMKARTILACGEDKTNLEIAREIGITNLTVGRWRTQFRQNRMKNFTVERRGRRVKRLALTHREKVLLESWSCSEKLSRSLVLRARIILACASGQKNIDVARKNGASPLLVSNLRQLFLRHGVEGLKPGRPGRKPRQVRIIEQEAR
jgi:hypothetical protein